MSDGRVRRYPISSGELGREWLFYLGWPEERKED